MKIAYFDCFSGISGDMCLGALVSAGVPLERLKEGLAGLPLKGYSLRAESVQRCGIAAVNFYVEVDQSDQPFRHLGDILEIINAGSLPADVAAVSEAVFKRLAAAEAAVHGTVVEKVHFHEVGAVDAIVDVVGTVLGLHCLGIEKVYASPLPLGRGFVECAHGVLPLPAPTALEILKGSRHRVYGVERTGELVTPTGAALVAALAEESNNLPCMRIERVGYGAGKREDGGLPNLLRLIVGEAAGRDVSERRRFDNGRGHGENHHHHHHQHHHRHTGSENGTEGALPSGGELSGENGREK